MAEFKQNYFQRKTKPRGPKANHRINSPEVQVISSNGENLGIINTNKAISMAKEEGLDLIEIAPNAKPPVCKIINMDKSHTILVHLFLSAVNFEHYECLKEKIIIGVNMFHLFKLINSIDNDDTLTIYIGNSDYNEGITSHLRLKI